MQDKYINSMERVGTGNNVRRLYNLLNDLITDKNNQDKQINENKCNEFNNRSSFVFFKSNNTEINNINSDDILFIKDLIELIDKTSTKYSLISTEKKNIDKIDATTLITFVLDSEENKLYKWNKIEKTCDLILEQTQKFPYSIMFKSCKDHITTLIELSDEMMDDVNWICGINFWDDQLSVIINYLNTHQENINANTQLSVALSQFFSWLPQYWPLLCKQLQEKLEYFDFLKHSHAQFYQQIIESIKNIEIVGENSLDSINCLLDLSTAAPNLPSTIQQELIKLLLEKLHDKEANANSRIIIYSLLYELRKFIDKELMPMGHNALMNLIKENKNSSDDETMFYLARLNGHECFWKNEAVDINIIEDLLSLMAIEDINYFDISGLKQVVYRICSSEKKLPEEEGSLFVERLLKLLKNSSEDSRYRKMGSFILFHLNHWIPENNYHDFVGLLINQLNENYKLRDENHRQAGLSLKELYRLFPIIQAWIPEETKSDIIKSYHYFLKLEDSDEMDWNVYTTFYNSLPINEQLNIIKTMMITGNIQFLSLYPIWEQNIQKVHNQVIEKEHDTPHINGLLFN